MTSRHGDDYYSEISRRLQPARSIEPRSRLRPTSVTRTGAVMTNAIQIAVTECWNSSEVAFGKLERLARSAAVEQAGGNAAAAHELELALWQLLRPEVMKTARSGIAGDPGPRGGRVVNGSLRLALQALQILLGFIVMMGITYWIARGLSAAIPNPGPDHSWLDLQASVWTRMQEIIATVQHTATMGVEALGLPAALTPYAPGAIVGATVARSSARMLGNRIAGGLVVDDDCATIAAQAVLQLADTHPSEVSSAAEPDDAAVRRSPAERIASVCVALEQLNQEWAAYERNLQDYYLDRPALRDKTVEATRSYHEAYAVLGSYVEDLSQRSSAELLVAAEEAATAALMAWGTARDVAFEIKTGDRSPTEQAALRRLYGLSAQLTDPTTPRQMWPNLIAQIRVEAAKLELASVPAAVLATQLQIEQRLELILTVQSGQ